MIIASIVMSVASLAVNGYIFVMQRRIRRDLAETNRLLDEIDRLRQARWVSEKGPELFHVQVEGEQVARELYKFRRRTGRSSA